MTRPVQWYPGHMAKAMRLMKEDLKKVDAVFEIVDARIPLSSSNPKLTAMLQNKPLLRLYNKIDLADEALTNKFIQRDHSENILTLKIDALSGKNINKIQSATETLLAEKRATEKRKGLRERRFRVMIVGIPNVGKSTLINRLVNKNVVKSGALPGVTRANQWLKIGPFDLLDTPGVLWPKFEDQAVGYKLALCSAIKDDILPKDDVLSFALSFFKIHYTERFLKHFHLTSDALLSEPDFYAHYAKARGLYEKGGHIDVDRLHIAFLKDVRAIGGITYDRPEDTL